MPKSEYPESVQDLPKDEYSQWTAVYHSARDDGDSKETAAKKAWGAVNESKMTWAKLIPKELKPSWGSLKEALDDDAVGVTELKLYIENDGDLYRQRVQPIMKNLARKMARGLYDPVKAIKLWMYLVDEGARKYVKEFGGPNEKWSNVFPKQERWAVAKQFAEEFEDAVNNDELDVDELADYKKPRGLEETQMAFGQKEPSMGRVTTLERMMMQVGLSYREMLEDVVEVLDNNSYKDVVKALREKYGYM